MKPTTSHSLLLLAVFLFTTAGSVLAQSRGGCTPECDLEIIVDTQTKERKLSQASDTSIAFYTANYNLVPFKPGVTVSMTIAIESGCQLGEIEWLKDDVLVDTGRTLATTEPGKYVVNVTYDVLWYTWTATESIELEYSEPAPTATSVTELLDPRRGTFKVFPNPATGRITMDLNKLEYSNGTALLYDLYGRVVWQATLAAEMPYRKTISVAHLPKGVYQLAIQTYNQMDRQTVIVQ